MPFKKAGPNDYVGPSGKHFTTKQVVAYYATDGWTKPVRKAGGGRRTPSKAELARSRERKA